MSWRIPPVGFCAVCLIAHGDETVAVTIVSGTALCREHVRHVPDPRPEKRVPETAFAGISPEMTPADVPHE